MIVTTGPSVEGRTVTHYLDVVSAQAIMGVNIGKGITGRAQEHRRRAVEVLRRRDRQGGREVMDELKVGAETLGADAIVSIDIDYETVGSNMLMVAASGTAVRLG